MFEEINDLEKIEKRIKSTYWVTIIIVTLFAIFWLIDIYKIAILLVVLSLFLAIDYRYWCLKKFILNKKVD